MSRRLQIRRMVATFGAAAALSCAMAPHDASDVVARARADLAQGDTTAATTTLEVGGARDSSDPHAARLLGQLYRDRRTIQGRLLSQGVLETAHARFPDDPEVAMELATTYFEQGFYPDAVRILHHVLARDSSRCDARTMLGLYHFQNWKRMNEYTDDLAAARRELRAAVACQPDDAGLALRYLIAGYALGDSIAGECDHFIARFPQRPEFHLMRGALAFEAGRYDACGHDFARGLELMDDSTGAAYRSLTDVLAAGDEARYLASSVDMRDHIARGLWAAADPDPTTEVNPAALEHVYRMFVVDCLYAHTDHHGWATDRGEAFVRYGRPLEIEYTMGDIFASGKVETWSWVTDGLFHQLVFVDEFLNGNPRIPYRADIDLHFMRHTPAVSTLGLDAAAIAGTLGAYAFRDPDMTTSVYLAMAVDADAVRQVVDVDQAGGFVVRGAYFDQTWVREGGFVDSVRTADVGERGSVRGPVFEVVRRVRVPCDRYHVSMAFEDRQAISRAVVRADVDAMRFLGDGLSMSDVLLFRDDAPTPAGAGVAIERGGSRMRPNIEGRYAAGEHLRAYVEIYDLALASHGGVRSSSYDLRYAIFPARENAEPVWMDWSRRAVEWVGFGDHDEAVISQTFRREGQTHDDRESIAIDIDVLEGGRYQLVVEVTDRVSGRRALVHAPFEKDGGPVARRDGGR